MTQIGRKQAKILGMCRMYGHINTDVVSTIYGRSYPNAKNSLKALVRKGYLMDYQQRNSNKTRKRWK